MKIPVISKKKFKIYLKKPIRCEQQPDGTAWMHGTQMKYVPPQITCYDQCGRKRPVGRLFKTGFLKPITRADAESLLHFEF